TGLKSGHGNGSDNNDTRSTCASANKNSRNDAGSTCKSDKNNKSEAVGRSGVAALLARSTSLSDRLRFPPNFSTVVHDSSLVQLCIPASLSSLLTKPQ